MAISLRWTIRGHELDLARPLVMGIVNATPDSFSDGGQYLNPNDAITHALRLIEDGADILDIGGESTRPGSQPVSANEELSRVLPVVRALITSDRLNSVLLSIDTSKAEVAAACLEAGAHIINDITALGDPAMAGLVRQFGAGLILMHMQGTPATMQLAPHYDDVVIEVRQFLEARLQACVDLGIASSCVVLDPGIGFGKSDEHNWSLLARLEEFQALVRPLCLGVSRKGFLGRLLGRAMQERMAGALAVGLDAIMHQSAHVLRVHDVAPTRDALRVLATLANWRENKH
jgi:dihydropteroate synthase